MTGEMYGSDSGYRPESSLPAFLYGRNIIGARQAYLRILVERFKLKRVTDRPQWQEPPQSMNEVLAEAILEGLVEEDPGELPDGLADRLDGALTPEHVAELKAALKFGQTERRRILGESA